LKLRSAVTASQARGGRPFAGAWIETDSLGPVELHRRGRPFAGAWIETNDAR